MYFSRDVYEDYFSEFYAPSNLIEKPKDKSELSEYVIKARKILALEAENWYAKAEKGMPTFCSRQSNCNKNMFGTIQKATQKF